MGILREGEKGPQVSEYLCIQWNPLHHQMLTLPPVFLKERTLCIPWEPHLPQQCPTMSYVTTRQWDNLYPTRSTLSPPVRQSIMSTFASHKIHTYSTMSYVTTIWVTFHPMRFTLSSRCPTLLPVSPKAVRQWMIHPVNWQIYLAFCMLGLLRSAVSSLCCWVIHVSGFYWEHRTVIDCLQHCSVDCVIDSENKENFGNYGLLNRKRNRVLGRFVTRKLNRKLSNVPEFLLNTNLFGRLGAFRSV